MKNIYIYSKLLFQHGGPKSKPEPQNLTDLLTSAPTVSETTDKFANREQMRELKNRAQEAITSAKLSINGLERRLNTMDPGSRETAMARIAKLKVALDKLIKITKASRLLVNKTKKEIEDALTLITGRSKAERETGARQAAQERAREAVDNARKDAIAKLKQAIDQGQTPSVAVMKLFLDQKIFPKNTKVNVPGSKYYVESKDTQVFVKEKTDTAQGFELRYSINRKKSTAVNEGSAAYAVTTHIKPKQGAAAVAQRGAPRRSPGT